MDSSLYLQELGELDPASPLGLEWDDLVRKSTTSGFMQSTHWSHLKRQTGFNVLHLGLFTGKKLCGGAMFFTASHTKGAGFLAAPDGPVLPWDEPEKARLGLQLLLEAARHQAKKLGVMAVRIAPRLTPPLPHILDSFSRAPLNLIEHNTLYLNLQPEPEELLAQMKPKARYNIGLARRKGVNIYEESSIAAARKFHAVMKAVAERNNFFAEPLSFFISLIDTLCPAGLARVFFAEHEEDILGALFMVTFGGRATYLYGGTTSVKRNLMGGYALQWAALNAARQSGCQVYDFWGFDRTSDPEHNYAGFSRFKSQFKGEPVTLTGTHDCYFMDHLADAVIRAMKEVYGTEPVPEVV